MSVRALIVKHMSFQGWPSQYNRRELSKGIPHLDCINSLNYLRFDKLDTDLAVNPIRLPTF